MVPPGPQKYLKHKRSLVSGVRLSFWKKSTIPPRAIPYITGFEFSRPALGATEVMVGFDIERNLYRHPDRQGSAMANFSKIHNLYALGVVLLEIGMWESTTSGLKGGIDHARKFGKLPPPEHIKQGLIKTTKEELPREIGTRYARVVVICLLMCGWMIPSSS